MLAHTHISVQDGLSSFLSTNWSGQDSLNDLFQVDSVYCMNYLLKRCGWRAAHCWNWDLIRTELPTAHYSFQLSEDPDVHVWEELAT